jgi:Bacterial mobilisation protein (MobC).
MLTTEEMKAIADIRNVGNNLNQIARCMHLGMDVSSDIQSIIEFIASVIHKIR